MKAYINIRNKNGESFLLTKNTITK